MFVKEIADAAVAKARKGKGVPGVARELYQDTGRILRMAEGVQALIFDSSAADRFFSPDGRGRWPRGGRMYAERARVSMLHIYNALQAVSGRYS